MNEPIHILAIVGSLRANSYNRALVNAAREMLPDGVTLELFDLAPIPMFNQDVEEQGLPEPVQQLHDRIRAADALLFATPEYNHQVPGVLKNAIDWASRPTGAAPIVGKPASIIGATTSVGGTARAQSGLRQSFVPLDMPVVNRPEVRVGLVQNKVDAEGNINDAETLRFLRGHIEALVALARRYKSSQH